MITRRFQIGDVCRMERGISPTLKTLPGPFPLVVTAEFRRSADTWQIEGPAVCVPLISSTGHGDAALHRVHFQDGKFALANLLVALIPRDFGVCDAKYLYYLLTARKDELLVPLMRGTANVSLKEKDISKVEVTLPPVDEQRRIVARIEELAAAVQQIHGIESEQNLNCKALLQACYEKVIRNAPRKPLGDVAPLQRRPVAVDVNQDYPQVAVRSFGKGTFHRAPLIGKEITWEKPYRVHAEDILISNIKAWEGAIAIATADDHNRVASHRYLTCVPIQGLATGNFVYFHLLTNEGLLAVGEASPGTADRNRTLSTKALLRIPMPVPEYKIQVWFDELCALVGKLGKVQAARNVELDALLPSVLAKAFSGEL